MRSLSIDHTLEKAGRGNAFFFRYFLLFAVLIFCTFQFNIDKIYGFSIYPDEFGYWASAAQMLGYDWSDTAALGYYYSFGYGVILAPILSIFHDSVTAYRAAVAVNALLQCGAVWMLWEIYRRLYRIEGLRERKMQVVLAVGTAAFYPPCSFYVQMTMVETLLTFLYLFICYQMVLFIEKKNMRSAVLLALALVYLYFVHMRTVGVVIAAVTVLLLYGWKNACARRSLIVAAVVLTAGMFYGLWIKENVMNTVYAVTDAEQLAVNDYAGQISNLKSMLTFKGISRLFFSGTGKFYYLVMASFGLLCPAFCICLKKTLQVLRRLSSLTEDFVDGDGNGCFYLFCLLSLLGQCMVTAIAAMNPGRLDGIFYGRYNEYLLPVLIGIGLMAICDARRKSCVYFASVGVSLILFGITFWDALHSGLTAMQGYFAPGISYFSDDWHYVVRPELWKAFLVGVFLMTVVTVCIGMAGRSGKYTGILAVLLLMESGLAFCLGEKYIRHFNDMNYYNLKIYQYMEDSEAPVSYLYGGGFSGIDLLQFALQDRKIEVIRAEELDLNGSEEGNNLPQEGFLIVDQGCGQLAEIEQNYTKCAESRAFVLFRIKETDEKDG